jgi:hypothetical protein
LVKKKNKTKFASEIDGILKDYVVIEGDYVTDLTSTSVLREAVRTSYNHGRTFFLLSSLILSETISRLEDWSVILLYVAIADHINICCLWNCC